LWGAVVISDSNNIVHLETRQSVHVAKSDGLGELVKQCRGIAHKHLSVWLGGMYDSVDDALFDLAKKAENSTIQKVYFDGMREVRKQRHPAERQFLEGMTQEFSQFAQARGRSTEVESAKVGLALLDEKDLEETLAVSSMIDKSTHQLAHHLYTIEQRLSVLVGGNKITERNNPISPRAVCQSFQSTLLGQDIDVNIKLLMLKLFEKNVMAELDVLYEEINEHLVAAGILPELKYPSAARQRSENADSTQNPDRRQPAAARSAAEVQSAAAIAEAELRIELYHTVRTLLSSRRAQLSGDYAAPTGPAFATNDLVNALSLLQSQGMAVAPDAALDPTTQWVPMMQIKQELVGQLRQLGAGVHQHQVAEVDEDTIDLVGMLFEFILQDRNLPTQMQALLARLQIPYLKCAILNKELFAQKDHPARQLLDELAQAGLSWAGESDRDGHFYNKVKSIVESLLKDFSDDLHVFERLLQDLREFLGSSRKRAEVAELRASEAARGRERLQAARQAAASEVLARIGSKMLPDVIRHILTRPWANVLVLILLRQGEGSNPWKTSLRVVDALVWAAQPKASDAERDRLRSMIPDMERALRHGLTMVAYHEHDMQELMAELSGFYQAQLSGNPHLIAAAVAVSKPVTDSVAPKSEEPGTGRDENFVDELARQAEPAVAEDSSDTQLHDQFYEAARAIKVGVWVEFRHDATRSERAKLSWISPISHKYLFVNRKGLKVADKTVWVLAAELRDARAVLLEDVPLFDRALDAIVARLKTSVSPA
jgi:hypothetical protein